jgi:hypothetical protein
VFIPGEISISERGFFFKIICKFAKKPDNSLLSLIISDDNSMALRERDMKDSVHTQTMKILYEGLHLRASLGHCGQGVFLFGLLSVDLSGTMNPAIPDRTPRGGSVTHFSSANIVIFKIHHHQNTIERL